MKCLRTVMLIILKNWETQPNRNRKDNMNSNWKCKIGNINAGKENKMIYSGLAWNPASTLQTEARILYIQQMYYRAY